MNTDDVQTVAEFAIRLRQILCSLQDLAEIPPRGSSAHVREDLRRLEEELGAFTTAYQRRVVIAWGQRNPREEPGRTYAPVRPPNRWIVDTPRESREMDAGVPVARFDIHGQQKPDRPPTSGRWRNDYRRIS
jgi:hypothetical protein